MSSGSLSQARVRAKGARVIALQALHPEATASVDSKSLSKAVYFRWRNTIYRPADRSFYHYWIPNTRKHPCDQDQIASKGALDRI